MILEKIGKVEASLTSACLSQRAIMEMLATEGSLLKGQILTPSRCEQIISEMEARQTAEQGWSVVNVGAPGTLGAPAGPQAFAPLPPAQKDKF